MKTYKWKSNMYMWTAFGLFIIGLALIITATVFQSVLSYEKFGAIITKNIFIPHWSAWFYLGGLPLGVGYFMWMIR